MFFWEHSIDFHLPLGKTCRESLTLWQLKQIGSWFSRMTQENHSRVRPSQTMLCNSDGLCLTKHFDQSVTLKISEAIYKIWIWHKAGCRSSGTEPVHPRWWGVFISSCFSPIRVNINLENNGRLLELWRVSWKAEKCSPTKMVILQSPESENSCKGYCCCCC